MYRIETIFQIFLKLYKYQSFHFYNNLESNKLKIRFLRHKIQTARQGSKNSDSLNLFILKKFKIYKI